ncbi:MAG: glycine/betaine/sarcosine/D-proline family reductase selenoprotein B [Streptococcaceae bacterium]|jgi:glycine reductase|nr:glycine/betaine/sarcosine/D-proline family reductase selenoprotein B [Streptococcaceae bacterium]
MKIIFILDQIQAGLGGVEQSMQPLGGKNMGIGSVSMFEKILPKVDGQVIATLYSGDEFFASDPETNALKMAAMVKKMNADVVVCGPCFHYEGYGKMAAQSAYAIETRTGIPTVSAMSKEVADVIAEYKEKINIVKMPKKGEVGLSESLEHILELAKLKAEQADTTAFVLAHCY